jgi:hypothetical protein
LTLRRTERGVVMACEFRLEPGSGWVFVASEQEKFLLALSAILGFVSMAERAGRCCSPRLQLDFIVTVRS